MTTNFDKTSRGATVPGSIIEWHKIYASGSLEDNTTIVAPISGYGDFRFPIIYKPYYYKAVIWEGYTVLSTGGTGNTLSYAQAYGVILVAQARTNVRKADNDVWIARATANHGHPFP